MNLMPGIVSGRSAAPPAAVTWDPVNSGTSIVLSNGNRTVTPTDEFDHQTVATLYRSSGKYYFEILCATIVDGTYQVGCYPSKPASAQKPGAMAGSFGVRSLGGGDSATGFFNNSGLGALGFFLTAGKKIGVAIDFGAGALWVSCNNAWATGSPSAGTSPLLTGLSGSFAPGATAGSDGSATLQAAIADLTYTPPTGFTAWQGS